MDELILVDRGTGLNVVVTIADGILCVNDSIETPQAEPVIADQRESKNWTLFVIDAMFGHEETSDVAGGSVELTDTTTGNDWRFQVLDGMLAYIHILGISTEINSHITQNVSSHSQVDEEVSDNSKIDQEKQDNSNFGQTLDKESNHSREINLDSGVN